MASKPHAPLMKKHSQTDLISRLKSRKILGVGGEDDDGEVHRSKVWLSRMILYSCHFYLICAVTADADSQWIGVQSVPLITSVSWQKPLNHRHSLTLSRAMDCFFKSHNMLLIFSSVPSCICCLCLRGSRSRNPTSSRSSTEMWLAPERLSLPFFAYRVFYSCLV